MSEVKMQESTLQEDKEKKETTEFIELLRALSRDEQNQVKGYMTCICGQCSRRSTGGYFGGTENFWYRIRKRNFKDLGYCG